MTEPIPPRRTRRPLPGPRSARGMERPGRRPPRARRSRRWGLPRPPERASLILSALAAAWMVAGCGATTATPTSAAPAVRDAQVASSADGVVSTAHPLATRAGVRMLERGGNAVDAAVAAAFALAVVEPSMSGLGGRTQIILRTADGEIHGIDATTQAPASYRAPEGRSSHGYAVVGVPGTVAGLTRAAERFGSLPLAELMAPAVELARNGFELLPGEAARHASAREQLLESEGARMHFLKSDGSTYAAGERFVQPALARTLEAVAEGGADAFYRGWIAERIVEDMREKGGHVTLRSLADYRAEESRVVRGSYRGLELAGLWVPSYGAITIEILHILETLPLAEMDEAEWAAAVHRAVELAYEDRSAQNGPADADRLTSKAWARRRAAELDLPWMAAPGGATSGPAAAAPLLAAAGAAAEWSADPGHTTHLTTADAAGTVVALTQSNGPNLGSKVVAPGLGFVYAATLGGYLGDMAPGERARSHISPFLVLRGGEPFLGLGAAGGGRIPPAIVQVVSRVVDRGMTLGDALRAPRVNPDGDGLDAETETGAGFDRSTLSTLSAWGYDVDPVERSGAFGRVHAVRWLADEGVWVGAADPDWEGTAAGPRPAARAGGDR